MLIESARFVIFPFLVTDRNGQPAETLWNQRLVGPDDAFCGEIGFVRAILSGDSPFDRYVNGDRTALTPGQQAGLQLFRGKANCRRRIPAFRIKPRFREPQKAPPIARTGMNRLKKPFRISG